MNKTKLYIGSGISGYCINGDAEPNGLWDINNISRISSGIKKIGSPVGIFI